MHVGLTHTMTHTVTPNMLAQSMKSTCLPVLATPMLVACMEDCCMECAQAYLPEGQTTVGTAVNIQHLAPTPAGMTVRVTCTLTQIDRRRLVFSVQAWDEQECIGQGEHERFIVDVEHFTQKCAAKLHPQAVHTPM